MSFDPIPWVDTTMDRDFQLELLHEPMPPRDRRRPKQVCVIGGGIAGLVAAYELKNLGHDVTLLEADERCGGRILTWRFNASNYGELGAMRIPLDHLCVWEYIRKFGLQDTRFVQDNVKAFYHLRGKRFRREPWNPVHPPSRNLYRLRSSKYEKNPALVLNEWIANQFKRLLTSEQWDVFNPAPTLPTIRKFEKYSVWQRIQGMLTAPPADRAFFRNEEWEYIGRATGILWDEKNSYLEALVASRPHFYTSMYTIVGGMERLVEAFEKKLTKEIQRSAPVTDIALDSKGVRVRWNSGGQSRENRFEYVISTVPAGATVRIQFSPALPAEKYEALTNLSYQSAAKSLALCKTRRWEWQDGIYGGGSHTDMEIQECWYPPDNALPDPHPKRLPDMVPVPSRGGPVEIARITEWVAKNKAVSHGPGVLIAAYMKGTNARRFASLPDHQRDTLVVTCLEKLHPGIQKDIVGIKHHLFTHYPWDAQPNPGGGAWAAFMPGERERYQEAMVAPHSSGKADDPRVFFAGEHLGITHGWIQPAIQTAQGAVWHVNAAH